MCNPSILDYLDSMPEQDRRYAFAVPKQRVDTAVRALGHLLGAIDPADVIQVMGEIGLIECIEYADDFIRDGIRLKMSDAQCIAAATVLAAVWEEMSRPQLVLEEVP